MPQQPPSLCPRQNHRSPWTNLVFPLKTLKQSHQVRPDYEYYFFTVRTLCITQFMPNFTVRKTSYINKKITEWKTEV